MTIKYGIGINNANKRLKILLLAYSEFGIKINAIKGKGTEVMIKIIAVRHY